MSVWRTGGPTGAARRAAACRSFSSAMECGAEHRISESPTDRLRRCASRLRVRRGKSRTKQSSPPAQGRLHRFGYPGRRPAARHENQCDAVARSRQPAAVAGHNIFSPTLCSVPHRVTIRVHHYAHEHPGCIEVPSGVRQKVKVMSGPVKGSHPLPFPD